MHASARLVVGAIALSAVATPVLAGSPEQERILWRFQMDSAISGAEAAVGPDGTIYCSDNTRLYALNPDGTVKWTRPGLGAGTPIDFLPDGTIISRHGVTVYALFPDGTTRWTHAFDGNNFQEQIEVGPNVGPDGNIYVVSSTDGQGHGLGAYSLTPEGELRWSDVGDPILNEINAGTGGRVYFTSERVIFPFRYSGDGPVTVFGYDFDGQQTLFVDFTCTGQPRTDPLDRLLIASACGIEALEQDGNQSFWQVQFGAVNLPPAVGDDATVYTGSWLDEVAAVRPDGSIAWQTDALPPPQSMLAVRQDVARLVYVIGGFGVPNGLAGVNVEDASLAWTVEFLTVNGHNELAWADLAPTSADGSTVYVPTRFTSNGEPGALYAVRIIDQAPCAADMDGSGAVGIEDLLELLSSWGACPGCPADLDGDGAVGITDLVTLLAAWGSCP